MSILRSLKLVEKFFKNGEKSPMPAETIVEKSNMRRSSRKYNFFENVCLKIAVPVSGFGILSNMSWRFAVKNLPSMILYKYRAGE